MMKKLFCVLLCAGVTMIQASALRSHEVQAPPLVEISLEENNKEELVGFSLSVCGASPELNFLGNHSNIPPEGDASLFPPSKQVVPSLSTLMEGESNWLDTQIPYYVLNTLSLFSESIQVSLNRILFKFFQLTEDSENIRNPHLRPSNVLFMSTLAHVGDNKTIRAQEQFADWFHCCAPYVQDEAWPAIIEQFWDHTHLPGYFSRNENLFVALCSRSDTCERLELFELLIELPRTSSVSILHMLPVLRNSEVRNLLPTLKKVDETGEYAERARFKRLVLEQVPRSEVALFLEGKRSYSDVWENAMHRQWSGKNYTFVS